MAAAGLFQDGQDLKKHGKRILKAPGNGENNPILAGSKWEDNGQHQENYQQRRPHEKGTSVAESASATSDSREAGRQNKMKYTSGGAPFATQEMYPFSNDTSAEHVYAPDYSDSTPRGQEPLYGAAITGRTLAKGPVSEYNPITWGVDGNEDGFFEQSSASGQSDGQITSMPQRFKGRASTHNPLTWEPYDGFNPNEDKPAHKSRFNNPAAAGKKSTFNPITGKDYVPEDDDNRQQSLRLVAHQ